jgi:hypothetical protein
LEWGCAVVREMVSTPRRSSRRRQQAIPQADPSPSDHPPVESQQITTQSQEPLAKENENMNVAQVAPDATSAALVHSEFHTRSGSY